MSKELLIIFVKNPELGKVKTRLAKSIGDKAALDVYKKLIVTTEKATVSLQVDRHIYFSDKISNDYWKNDHKKVQQGIDLGERMCNAFKNGFESGFDRIILIGSDLPGISKEIISEAFYKLQETAVIFGPSQDGGYYLVGMNKLHLCIFKNMPWSTSNLLDKTLEKLYEKNVAVSLMQTLNDIDTFEDLKEYPEYLKLI